MREDLKVIKLTDFNSENSISWIIKVISLAERLDSAGLFGPILCVILLIYFKPLLTICNATMSAS